MVQDLHSNDTVLNRTLDSAHGMVVRSGRLLPAYWRCGLHSGKYIGLTGGGVAYIHGGKYIGYSMDSRGDTGGVALVVSTARGGGYCRPTGGVADTLAIHWVQQDHVEIMVTAFCACGTGRSAATGSITYPKKLAHFIKNVSEHKYFLVPIKPAMLGDPSYQLHVHIVYIMYNYALYYKFT